MTTIGNVLTSARKNFEINSQADGGDLAASVSALNNLWSEFNNITTSSNTEAMRSILLGVMDVYDIFVKSTNHNMVNNAARVVVLADRLLMNLEHLFDVLNPSLPSYDNGYVSKSLILDIFSDATAIFAAIAQFTKFSPIGVAVNIASMFVTQVSNSMNSLPDWNARQKISQDEIAGLFLDATSLVLTNWATSVISIASVLENILPDGQNPWDQAPIELMGSSENDNFTEDLEQRYIIWGNAGNDHLSGGNYKDTLYGGLDSDSLYGRGGNDYLDGGKGDDYFVGGSGDDTLVDAEGFDTYVFSTVGNDGRDIIYDQDGSGSIVIDGMTISGGEQLNPNLWKSADGAYRIALVSEFDGVTTTQSLIITKADDLKNSIIVKSWTDGNLGITLVRDATPEAPTNTEFANNGNNVIINRSTVFGLEGNDYILATDNNDYIYGDGGNDLISTKDGSDTIDGGAGNDIIFGGLGRDVIFGGNGNDLIFSSATLNMQKSEIQQRIGNPISGQTDLDQVYADVDYYINPLYSTETGRYGYYIDFGSGVTTTILPIVESGITSHNQNYLFLNYYSFLNYGAGFAGEDAVYGDGDSDITIKMAA